MVSHIARQDDAKVTQRVVAVHGIRIRFEWESEMSIEASAPHPSLPMSHERMGAASDGVQNAVA